MTDTYIRITRIIAPHEVATQIVPAMTRLGNAIAKRGQRAVPKRTWKLHDTIAPEVEVVDAAVITHVRMGGGPNRVDYGLHVERGTSRMMAQPFMRPALYQSKSVDLNFAGSPDPRHNGVS